MYFGLNSQIELVVLAYFNCDSLKLLHGGSFFFLPRHLTDVDFGFESIGPWYFLPLLSINEQAFVGSCYAVILVEGRIIRVNDLRIDSSLFITADVARIHKFQFKYNKLYIIHEQYNQTAIPT